MASDSNNFHKIAGYWRKMELQFNLAQVLSPRNFLPKEQPQILEEDKQKNSIQETLKQQQLQTDKIRGAWDYLYSQERNQTTNGQCIK